MMATDISVASGLDSSLTPVLDWVLTPAEWVFGRPWVAPFVILPLLVLSALWMGLAAQRKARPEFAAGARFIKAIRAALGSDPDPDTSRKTFSANFAEICNVLDEKKRGDAPLAKAWSEFRETIVDETAQVILNTARPYQFIHRAEPGFTNLVFWSNAFVGIGLLLTFMGLIVALRTAAHGMQGSVAQSQGALITLLTVSGAKFFSSVSGVGASLLLRFFERGLVNKARAQTREISELIEQGMSYIPPQRLATQQLVELREQTAQLKTFNQDTAFLLAEKINTGVTQGVAAAFAPVVTSIENLNASMTEVTSGIGQGAAKAIAEVSGNQLNALSSTLERLSEKIEGITSAVGSSGGEAANQIRQAGEDFRKAAGDIRGAFETLQEQIGGLGREIVSHGDETNQRNRAALEEMLARLEVSQKQSADAITEAIKSIKDASTAASEDLRRGVNNEFEGAIGEVGDVFKGVLQASGASIREASIALATAVKEAGDQVERAGDNFVASGAAAQKSAASLSEIPGAADGVVRAFKVTSQAFASVAEPVAATALSLRDASTTIASSIEASRDAERRAVSEMQALASQIKATSTAAEEAWSDYRSRFEGVDKALEKSTLALGESLGASLDDFRKFASKFDYEIAQSISKLGATIDNIAEYAGSLDEYVNRSGEK